MKKIILVPMKREDRAEDLLPYVEEVARPGMKAVFITPFLVDGFRWSTEVFGHKAIQEGISLARYYTWDVNLRKAEASMAPVLKSLSAKGIDAKVELYAGNLRSAVRQYTTKGDVHMIVTRMGIGERLAGLFGGVSSLLGLIKRPSFAPVLLIQPGAFA